MSRWTVLALIVGLGHESSPGAVAVSLDISKVTGDALWTARVNGTSMRLGETGERLTSRIDGLEAGNYSLEVRADGVAVAEHQVIVGPGCTTQARIVIKPRPR